MSFNNSDNSSYFDCEKNLTTIYSSYFGECLKHFLTQSIPLTIIDASMVVMTTWANFQLMYLLVKNNCIQTVFGRIFFSHALVDLVMNLFDLPLYHILTIFKSFPLGKAVCFYYQIIDNSLSSIEILHFFYMSYCRTRCILAPKVYHNEFLIKHSNSLIAFIWIICTMYWTPLVYFYSFKVYVEGSCSLIYTNPYVAILIISIGYHLPLFFTVGTAIFFLIAVKAKMSTFQQSAFGNKRRLARKRPTQLSQTKKLSFDNPQVKLSIVIFVFIACYFPYATALIVLQFEEVPVSSIVYIFTSCLAYSASLWNPVLILTLNYKLFNKK